VSHQPERKERNCLNCGATVAGRFCQVCGQENIVAKQSVWGLIRHFVYDLFHFDGKFFDTLRSLFFRPGYIPLQYVSGRRTSYLDPIRMYLFTSAVFFIIFFSISDPVKDLDDGERRMTRSERLEYASVLYQKQLTRQNDSLDQKQLRFLLDTSFSIILTKEKTKAHPDSTFPLKLDNDSLLMVVKKTTPLKVTVKASGWFENKLQKNLDNYKNKFGDDRKAMIRDMMDTFLHTLPYLLFVSLPFFALILQLLYLRRKHFYYSDHAVFTLYHYIFTFILIMFTLIFERLDNITGGWFFNLLRTLFIIYGAVYLLVAMRRFYRQNWGKTILKFILLNFLAFNMIMLLMVVFILFSLIQV
jgi:hypothetical protein